MAVADPVLQRDAPLPAGLAGGGARVRGRLGHARAGHGHGPVARQPVAPVLVTGLQGLLDQQAAEARAVDEQLALDALAAVEHDRFDEAVLAAQDRVDDLALGTHDAELLGVAAQVARVQAGIEMEGVEDVGQRRVRLAGAAHEAAEPRGDLVEGVAAKVGDLAESVQL